MIEEILASQKVSIREQIKCAERELRMREKTYDRWVAQGKITRVMANNEREAMKAIIETLKAINADFGDEPELPL